VWVGMESGSPTCYEYIHAGDGTLRKAIRLANAKGTMGREFPQSLRVFLGVNPQTNQVNKWIDVDEWSNDLVRVRGTKGSGIKGVLLNKREGDPAMPVYTFNNDEELMNSQVVKALVESRAKELIGDTAKVKEITLSAPLDMVRERKDVAEMFARPTREDVLKSLKADEIQVALSGNSELRSTVSAYLAKDDKAQAEFDAEARKVLGEAGLTEGEVALTMSTHKFSDRDLAKVKDTAQSLKRIVNKDPGASQKPQTQEAALSGPDGVPGAADPQKEKQLESRDKSLGW
jgi:hypothetical protein